MNTATPLKETTTMRTATRKGAATIDGEKVKQLRTAKGWKRERLAVESDVSYPTLMRVERKNGGDMETARRLAKALNVTMEALLQ